MKRNLKKLLFVFFTIISIMSYSEDFIPSKKEIIEKFTENSKNIKSMDIIAEDAIVNKNNNDTLIIYKEASLILKPFSMKLSVKMPSFDNMYMPKMNISTLLNLLILIGKKESIKKW